MDLGLDGKACAITGASRGIGREVAERLCAEGASVLLVARSADKLAEVEDNADAIVFLCSERASYVAGAAWSVDGGTVQVII